MSEIISEAESVIDQELLKLIAEHKQRILTAKQGIKDAQKAHHEAVSGYERYLREILSGQEILFSGQISKGEIMDMDGPTMTRRVDVFNGQKARVSSIFANEDEFGNLKSEAFLDLIGGKADKWKVSVYLEHIDWRLSESD